jgi:glutamate-1-semialdehyde 2,1-aminomutase
MDYLAPLGPVYQAGTLSGNPLAMAAGIASLKMLKDNPPYQHLEKLGTMLAGGIREVASEKGIALQVPQTGSMFCLFFSHNPVSNFDQATAINTDSFKTIFQSCLANGVYLPPSAYETCFISAAHSEDDISKTLEQVRIALS